jgi:hypothetical protein
VTTVGKAVLGMMGRLRPEPATGDSASTIALPEVDPHGGMPLMEALAARRSSREFAPDPLPLPEPAFNSQRGWSLGPCPSHATNSIAHRTWAVLQRRPKILSAETGVPPAGPP